MGKRVESSRGKEGKGLTKVAGVKAIKQTAACQGEQGRQEGVGGGLTGVRPGTGERKP